jgi:hypothetical protein
VPSLHADSLRTQPFVLRDPRVGGPQHVPRRLEAPRYEPERQPDAISPQVQAPR